MMTVSSAAALTCDDDDVDIYDDDENNNNNNNIILKQCFGEISMTSSNYPTLQYFCVLGNFIL
jgi:hypothetical protein